MTTPQEAMAERLRAWCAEVRRRPMPLSEAIPMVQAAADLLERQAQPVAWMLRPIVQRTPGKPLIRGLYWGPRTKEDFEFASLDGDEYVPLYAAPQPDEIAAAVAAERERCAKLCEQQGAEWDSDAVQTLKNYAAHCATLIRLA